MALNTLLGFARDALAAAIATLGFAVIFNAPRRTLGWCMLCGVVAWAVRQMLMDNQNSQELATLVAAIVLGAVAEAAARWLRAPAPIFIVTGLVPLVPGVLSYRTVLFFIEGDYAQGSVFAVRTALIAGAIAGGISVVTALFRLRERPGA